MKRYEAGLYPVKGSLAVSEMRSRKSAEKE
jgi:hypothetical protein